MNNFRQQNYPQANFLPERLIIINQSLPALRFGNIMMMVMAYFLLKGTVPNQSLYTVILINFVITLISFAYDLFISPAAMKDGRALSDNGYIKRSHIVRIIVINIVGLAWGSSAVLFIHPIQGDFLNLTEQASPTALYVSTMVTVSGLAIALGVVPSMFVGFALCAMLPYIGILLLHPATNYNWMGYGAITCLMTAFFLAKQTYDRTMRTLKLQHENALLLRDLKAESQALEKANKEKSRFLTAASHDLRQPLHTVSLFLGVLQKELTTDTQKNRLEGLQQAVEVQSQLLNSLLDVSRLDSGNVIAKPAHISVNKVLVELKDEFTLEAAEQQRELIIDDCNLTAYTDKLLLQRILRNLLSNTFHHTQSGPIQLGVKQTESCIAISVKDFGSGISKHETENIYSELYQLNNPERDRNKGLGLGLSIVKRLCDLLDHPITLESTLGVGTCFTLEIPRGEPNKVKINKNSASDVNTAIAGHIIMVIDDVQGILDAMQIAVEQWSCQFISATSADAALKLIESGTEPDILICDYRLPGDQTGVDCVKNIRSVLGKDIPALIISGDNSPELLEQISGKQLNLMRKPVQFAQLRIAITHLLHAQEEPLTLNPLCI